MERIVIKGSKVYVVEETIDREIKADDFIEALRRTRFGTTRETPLLSPYTIAYKASVQHTHQYESVVIELPPRVWQLQFTKHFDMVNGQWVGISEEDRTTEIYQVAGPYLYFPLRFTNGEVSTSGMRLYSRASKATTLDDRLDIAPWPNTQNAVLCLDQTVDLLRQNAKAPLAERINHIVYGLMGTEFNNHNPEWCPVPGDVLTIDEWARRTEEDPDFVLNCSFQSARCTIQQVLDGH